MSYPIKRIRADFPILQQRINDRPLVYLDSAASAQKPQAVIDRLTRFYASEYASVHRGIHTLSAQATAIVEQTRSQVANFINARTAEEIVFVRGTTEAINLVANSYGDTFLEPGDNVIISAMEHHANIVPWQMLAKRKQIEVRILPIDAQGRLCVEQLAQLIDSRSRILSITHLSNVLGILNPVQEMIALAKSHGIVTLLDGAQAVMHHPIDVQALGCDFYAFSGHKLFAPSGIGVLYGRQEILQTMPPWEGGGAMIREVYLTQAPIYADAPWRFEAGTPHIAGIVGLGAAIEYVSKIGMQAIQLHEKSLTEYAVQTLAQIPDLVIYGSAPQYGVISFNLGKLHAFDVGSFLDQYGIAIRTGHHCAMPLMNHFGVSSMARASFAAYTTLEDVDALVEGLRRIKKLLG